jgi:hypothetical protein
MRTRLDEIVEEELRVGVLGISALDATLAAKRIAARVFRHGVEQGRNHPQAAARSVQPAPAMEDDPSYKPGMWYRNSHGVTVPSRRSGERRKGVHLRHGFDYFYPDGPDTYRRDRRSGRERRRK